MSTCNKNDGKRTRTMRVDDSGNFQSGSLLFFCIFSVFYFRVEF